MEKATFKELRGLIPRNLNLELEKDGYRLLSRPPFSLVSAIADAVRASTGFGGGLFSEEELSALEDKRGKLVYLVKLLQAVDIASQRPVASVVNPLNILAGKEASATNYFFVCLAIASRQATSVQKDAVERVCQESVGFWYSHSMKKRKLLVKAAAVLKGAATRSLLRRSEHHTSLCGSDPFSPISSIATISHDNAHVEGSDSTGRMEEEHHHSTARHGLLPQHSSSSLSDMKFLSLKQRQVLIMAREVELAKREERLQRTAQKLRRDRQRLMRKKNEQRAKFLNDMRKERRTVEEMRLKAEKLMRAAREREDVSRKLDDGQAKSKLSTTTAVMPHDKKQKQAHGRPRRAPVHGDASVGSLPPEPPAAVEADFGGGGMKMQEWMDLYKSGFRKAYGVVGPDGPQQDPAATPNLWRAPPTLPISSSLSNIRGGGLKLQHCDDRPEEVQPSSSLPQLQFDPAGSPSVPAHGQDPVHSYEFWRIADHPPALEAHIALSSRAAPSSVNNLALQTAATPPAVAKSSKIAPVATKPGAKKKVATKMTPDERKEHEEALATLEEVLRGRKIRLMELLTAHCSRHRQCESIYHMKTSDMRHALEKAKLLTQAQVDIICNFARLNEHKLVDINFMQKHMRRCFHAQAAVKARNEKSGAQRRVDRTAPSLTASVLGETSTWLDGFDKELSAAIDHLAHLGVVV
jgi:hypothetical protein